MKEKPILFSTPMVQAIRDGRKTMTRRVVKPQPEWVYNDGKCKTMPFISVGFNDDNATSWTAECPYGQVGSKLWIRETFSLIREDGRDKVMYRADTPEITSEELQDVGASNWRPSIFMRREHSRITLEITDIRVERLNSITEEDALREGIFKSKTYFHSTIHPIKGTYQCWTSGREAFLRLWDSINAKKYPWSSNPWVWAIEFRRSA